MSIEVRLPQFGDAMAAAKVGVWLKREGDRVTSGEPIVEVETDKTNMEIEAPASGVLQKILIPAGSEGVMVNALLATIGEVHESAPAARPVEPSSEEAVSSPAAPQVVETRAPLDVAEVTASAVAPTADVNATPVARKIANFAGIDLATIRPADGARITKSDVELALGKRAASPASASTSTAGSSAVNATVFAAAPFTSSPFEDRPLSNVRRVTAARLLQAKQTVPHFYLEAACRVDALMDLRAQWNARGMGKVTVTDLLVFAASRALRTVPLANSAWTDTAVRVFEHADIAVAVNTPKGLMTPIVRGAERKSILGISRELSMLAERARNGSLKPDEYTGGTFTISNLGMFGVTSIVPIINTPQACILGVGAVERRPVVDGQTIVAGRTMICTLAADHRAIDGATGAEFLAELRRLIEDPLSMTLEA
jgi:pyruvate dehydrogenase E2 component (dihydrolipoamide acetyltransferase)